MKRIVIKLIGLLFVPTAFTTANAQSLAAENKVPAHIQGSWYKKAAASGSYGIDLQGAKDLLKGKKMLKVPVVALIGTGADIEHEALQHAIWLNSKEKADTIDNDKNSYIDDIHGWNFVAGKDGSFMEKTTQNADREWLRLKDKYADLFFDGTKYFVIENGNRKYVESPKNMEEYNYFMNILKAQRTTLGNSYAGHASAYLFKEYTEKWDKMISQSIPGKTRNQITLDEAQKLVVNDLQKKDSLANIAGTFLFIYGNMMKSYTKDGMPTWEIIYNNFMNKQIDFSRKSYENNYAQFGNDNRAKVVGDDPNNLNNGGYGSNKLLTSASGLGTLLSGIIAGKDVNATGFSGILPEAKLMHLVISAQTGDPYPKDMVLAIRYAIQQGADVIVLPQQNRFYSAEQKTWLNGALREAEKKGILVITPVWEAGEDIDKVAYYPSQVLSDGKELTNLLTVANSDEKGNPFSMANYGKKQVSMFAPGVGIYSSLPGDVYKLANSAAFSSGVTAGAAAFLKAYFPKLTAVQLKNLLMSNVTSMKGKEVEKSTIKSGKPVVDQFLYEQLCQAAGILNLRNAVEAAVKLKN